MIKIFKNPFYIYIVSFAIVFALYSLGWSNMYPDLSFSLLLFFGLTFLTSLLFGFFAGRSKFIVYNKRFPSKSGRGEVFSLSIIIVGVIIELLYEGGSPLIAAIKGEPATDYRDFGIKVIHVILVSYNSFLIVYMFHLLISTKKKKYFIYYLITFIPPLLIFSRGMIIIGLASSFFVFIASLKKNISIKQTIILLAILIGTLYSFGILGNIRLNNSDENYLLTNSDASENFYKSNVPKEFFWTYLYGASPLANFQQNIDKTESVNFNFFELVVSQMTPDVISKRIQGIFGLKELDSHRIRDWLTVGTMYTKSYSYAKWFGPILLYIYSIFLVLVIIGLVPKKSKYHVSTVAILSTIIFMNTFSNMFTFSGLILQLFYPVFFAYFENKKVVVK